MGVRSPQPLQSITVTTGALFRNAGTDLVVVSLLNQDPNRSHTVTVSVLDWQNTCDPTEYDKFAFLCGDIQNPPENGNGNGIGILNGAPFIRPIGFLPITTPFTFLIPPRKHLVIHAHPTDPVAPPSPLYEVQVALPTTPIFLPTDPIFPTDPIYPTDPIHPVDPIAPSIRVIANTWGINTLGTIQEGNTVLHHQFLRDSI